MVFFAIHRDKCESVKSEISILNVYLRIYPIANG